MEPLPACVSATGMPGLLRERAQGVGRLAVAHAAAGEDDRPLAGADPLGGRGDGVAVRAVARDRPGALLEHLDREVERVGLDVLREAEEHGAGVGRGREDPHHLGQRRDELLRAVDPVPVADDRAERVVRARVLGARPLQLLEDRRLDPLGERVAGHQQHRHVVDRGRRGARDHVGRARADRRQAGERAQAVLELRVADRRVDHRLLVAGQVVREVGLGLLDRLRDAADVPVAEDAPQAREEPGLVAVPLHVLHGEVVDECLAGGQPPGCHLHVSCWGVGGATFAAGSEVLAGAGSERPRQPGGGIGDVARRLGQLLEGQAHARGVDPDAADGVAGRCRTPGPRCSACTGRSPRRRRRSPEPGCRRGGPGGRRGW